ncbi:hypothetical protein D1AOALGA4SA_6402 [Olavius algarvensis Delta 1 endosymbiont]|nr:hypothetical protein D1AOALGA4SA_6402 [Olavius algarvensis Delta 1 endosymbiont]
MVIEYFRLKIKYLWYSVHFIVMTNQFSRVLRLRIDRIQTSEFRSKKWLRTLCTSRNCMKIGHRFNLGIQGLRNLGIEGILSFLIY